MPNTEAHPRCMSQLEVNVDLTSDEESGISVLDINEWLSDEWLSMRFQNLFIHILIGCNRRRRDSIQISKDPIFENRI